MKRALLTSFLAAFAAHAFVSGPGITTVAAQAQPPDGPLTFFKNYFVTGDYAVAGVGLRGTGVNGVATGVIQFQSPSGGRVVPLNADIMAAFLYWETVETPNSGGGVGAKFRGNNIDSIAYVVNPAGTAPCWSSGGGTGAQAAPTRCSCDGLTSPGSCRSAPTARPRSTRSTWIRWA